MNESASQLPGTSKVSLLLKGSHDNTLTFRDIRLRQLAREMDGVRDAVELRPMLTELGNQQPAAFR